MSIKMDMNGYISYEQLLHMDSALALFPDLERKVLKHFNINDLADLPEYQFDKAIEYIDELKRERESRI